jgi:thymidylate synthase ThyX
MNLSIRELNELIYSLGTTANKGMMCDKELNATLLDKLQCELNYRIGLEAIDEEIEVSSHYVSNEEADEDYRSTLQQDSDRYESSVEKDYANYLAKLNERGFVTQALLDFVDRKGAVSHGELETYYKQITGGSNSFSHILQSLRTPYKNRKTQRYVAKEGKRYTDAKYIIKVANPSNWVVAES